MVVESGYFGFILQSIRFLILARFRSVNVVIVVLINFRTILFIRSGDGGLGTED